MNVGLINKVIHFVFKFIFLKQEVASIVQDHEKCEAAIQASKPPIDYMETPENDQRNQIAPKVCLQILFIKTRKPQSAEFLDCYNNVKSYYNVINNFSAITNKFHVDVRPIIISKLVLMANIVATHFVL